MKQNWYRFDYLAADIDEWVVEETAVAGGGPGDSNFRLNTIQHGSYNSGDKPDFDYTYDLVGNILSINTLTGSSDLQTFTYDDLNRLLTAGATGGVANYSQTFAYSKIGNITNFAGTTYGYNDAAHKQAVTHLAGVQKFWYDANGNMTKRVEGSVTYDPQVYVVENRLISVTKVGTGTTTFAYDAAGQRVKTVQPGGITTYFPFPGYEETVNGANTIKRSSYSFAGQMVAFRVTGDPANSGLFYVLSDHLGSTSLLVNSSGGTVTGSTTRYLPFGGYRGTAPSQSVTDRDFTGQKENRELGLLYYNARFYVPGIGRFASADSLVPNPANPQAYNRYSYVENRPLNFNDPTGHCSFDPQSPHEYYSCLEQASNASIESGISFDYLSQFDWGSLSGEEIREIWFYFVLQEQGSLLKAYGTREDGSSKVKFANFAKGNSVSPSTEKELVAMMGTGRRAVEAVIENFSFDENMDIECSCNSLVGAYFGLQDDIYHSMRNNQGYTSNFNFSSNLTQDINANVVLFTNSPTQDGRPLHSAVMASPNYNNQDNSIILQVDGNLTSSGIFFTTVGNNQYFVTKGMTPYYLHPKP